MNALNALLDEYGRANTAPLGTLNDLRQKLDALRAEVLAETHTVYRASHDSIVMGLYTTAAEARKHCETVVRREHVDSDCKVSLWWREDEDTVDQPQDGEAELYEHVKPNNFGGRGYTQRTGYVITPLEVVASYEEEADE